LFCDATEESPPAFRRPKEEITEAQCLFPGNAKNDGGVGGFCVQDFMPKPVEEMC